MISAHDYFIATRKKSTLPLFVVHEKDYADWLNSAPSFLSEWLKQSGFVPRNGRATLLPALDGLSGALLIVSEPCNPWSYAELPAVLKTGTFEVEPEIESNQATALVLGYALGCYRFERYKKNSKKRQARMVWPEAADKSLSLGLADGFTIARDLVNTPANDMGPSHLSAYAKALAKKQGAQFKEIVGDALLKKNYPMIHAVGRAAENKPRLIDLRWGKAKHPTLTLVGKGVCFDTGGLDLKPSQYMKLMKKDMGGAALVLGLAHTIMALKLPVQLRVLIPAVENSVAGNAMRPLDILDSRKGITVEVGDTDAEGRLVLADAITEALNDKPDLLIDAATLTGAARVALGTGMPAVFSQHAKTYDELRAAAPLQVDPLWQLPLHEPYRAKLNSKVADISNIGTDGYGGAITAALFLREFVGTQQEWLHIDTMGYNLENRPGRPSGGEALGLISIISYLQSRYGDKASAFHQPDSSEQLEQRAPVNQTAESRRGVSQKSTAKKAKLSTPRTVKTTTATTKRAAKSKKKSEEAQQTRRKPVASPSPSPLSKKITKKPSTRSLASTTRAQSPKKSEITTRGGKSSANVAKGSRRTLGKAK